MVDIFLSKLVLSGYHKTVGNLYLFVDEVFELVFAFCCLVFIYTFLTLFLKIGADILQKKSKVLTY
jgi:hypothetical protein